MATKRFAWNNGEMFTVDYTGNTGTEIATIFSAPNNDICHRTRDLVIKNENGNSQNISVVQYCIGDELELCGYITVPINGTIVAGAHIQGIYIVVVNYNKMFNVYYSNDGIEFLPFGYLYSSGINTPSWYIAYENSKYYFFTPLGTYSSNGIGAGFTKLDSVTDILVTVDDVFSLINSSLNYFEYSSETWKSKYIPYLINNAKIYSDGFYLYVNYEEEGIRYCVNISMDIIYPCPVNSENCFYYQANNCFIDTTYISGEGIVHKMYKDGIETILPFKNSEIYNLYGSFIVHNSQSKSILYGDDLLNLTLLDTYNINVGFIIQCTYLEKWMPIIIIDKKTIHFMKKNIGMGFNKYPVKITLLKNGVPFNIKTNIGSISFKTDSVGDIAIQLNVINGIGTCMLYNGIYMLVPDLGGISYFNVIKSDKEQTINIDLNTANYTVKIFKDWDWALNQTVILKHGDDQIIKGIQLANGYYEFKNILVGEYDLFLNGEFIETTYIDSDNKSTAYVNCGNNSINFLQMTELPTQYIHSNEGWFLDGANGLRNKKSMAHSSSCSITFNNLGKNSIIELFCTQNSQTNYDYSTMYSSAGIALANTKGLGSTYQRYSFNLTDGILKITYQKNASLTTGSDCTWIRVIGITFVEPPLPADFVPINPS